MKKNEIKHKNKFSAIPYFLLAVVLAGIVWILMNI